MNLQSLLCINNKPVNNSYNVPGVLARIKEGHIYEGYQKEADTPNGSIELVWIIPSLGLINDGYALERFIPLSDTPAEVIEEKETVHETA